MKHVPSGGFIIDGENSNLIDIKDEKDISKVDFLQEYRITVQKHIVKNIVMPNYVADLTSTFLWRSRWQKISRSFFWLSNIFLLISGIFSFLQIELPNTTFFSMIAGICNIMTLMLLNFGADAKKESRLLTTDTNTLLQTVGLTTIRIPESQENNFASTIAKS